MDREHVCIVGRGGATHCNTSHMSIHLHPSCSAVCWTLLCPSSLRLAPRTLMFPPTLVDTVVRPALVPLADAVATMSAGNASETTSGTRAPPQSAARTAGPPPTAGNLRMSPPRPRGRQPADEHPGRGRRGTPPRRRPLAPSSHRTPCRTRTPPLPTDTIQDTQVELQHPSFPRSSKT